MRLLLPVLFCLFVGAAFAQNMDHQVRLGLRGGIGTSDLMTQEVLFSAGGRDFGLALEKARYSLHGGLFLQVRAKRFVFQPEVLFNSSRTDYRLREFGGVEILESLRSETYQYIDVPMMLAYKLGPLRLQAGPVGHVFVSSSSDLDDIADYDADFERLRVGYQAGLGIDLWNVLLDFKYQGAFEPVADHLSFGGSPVGFSERPGGLVLGAGLSFN